MTARADMRPDDARAWPDASRCGLCGHRESKHWAVRCQGEGQGCTCERFVSRRAVDALMSWKSGQPVRIDGPSGGIAEAVRYSVTPHHAPLVYAELAPEPPRDPDDVARSLAAAAGAPWSGMPELERRAWRRAAEQSREYLRSGRLKLDDLCDITRMRQHVAELSGRVEAELAERAERERRAAQLAAVDLLVAVVNVCCRAAANGLLELDLEDRPHPTPRPDGTDLSVDDTAARYGQMEMD